MKTTMRATILSAFTAATVVLARHALADTVVQIPVDSVLDGRSVSTLNGATVVPWTPGQGLDGDGNSDGFVTTAVEAVLFQQMLTNAIGKALPDDGVFPADARHPDIVLHFSNAAPTTSPQTHQVHIAAGPQTFHFAVPQATYSKMFLLITSSEGVAALTTALTYADGTPASTQNFMLPDYGIGGAPANDPIYFNLIAGMRKWNTQDREGDSTTHTITGIELTPSTTGMLADIQVTKTNGAHVVFWGATGIATSAVDAGSPAGDDAGSAGSEAGAAGDAEAEAQAGTGGGDDASGPNGSSGGTATDSGAASDSGASGTASGSSGGSTTPGASNSGGSSGCSLSGRAGGDFSAWMLLLVLWATTRKHSPRAGSRRHSRGRGYQAV